MIAAERETTVAINDADELVQIWSARQKDITAMRKKPEVFTEIRSTVYDGTECVSFTAPKDRFSVAQAAKTKMVLTDEQRDAMRTRGVALALQARSAYLD